MAPEDADELTKRHLLEPDRDLIYDGTASDQGKRIRLKIAVHARVVARAERYARVSVQSTGAPL